MNKTIFSIVMALMLLAVGVSASTCYQESANESACLGQSSPGQFYCSSGTYDGSHPCELANDKDWDTYAVGDGSDNIFIALAYEKPTFAVNATWRVRFTANTPAVETMDLQIPSGCLNNVQLVPYVRVENNNISFSCYNADTAEEEIIYEEDGVATNSRTFQEESVFWNIVWNSTAWGYYVELNLTNTTHTNEPMVYDLADVMTQCNSDCAADFGDIRVFDDDTESLLPFEFLNDSYEHPVSNSDATKVQFIVPDASHTIRIFYGNSNATATNEIVFNYTYVFDGDIRDWPSNDTNFYDTTRYINDGNGLGSLLANNSGLGGSPLAINSAQYISAMVYDDGADLCGSCGNVYIGLASFTSHLQLMRTGYYESGDKAIVLSWNGYAGGGYSVIPPRWINMKIKSNYGATTELYIDNVLDVNSSVDYLNEPADSYWFSNNYVGASQFWVDNLRSSDYDFNQYEVANLPLFLSPCVPNWNCTGYGSCLENDTQPCNETTDLNTCGEFYMGNFSEFEPLVCDFCTPDWFCTAFDYCHIENITGCDSVDDLNTCGENFTGDLNDYNEPCVYVCNWECDSCDTNTSECLNVIQSVNNTCSVGEPFTGNLSDYDIDCLVPCTPDWNCSSFDDCIGDVEECLAVTDLNTCGDPFSGSLSDYDQACVTPPPVTGYVSLFGAGDLPKVTIDGIVQALLAVLSLTGLIVLGFVVVTGVKKLKGLKGGK